MKKMILVAALVLGLALVAFAGDEKKPYQYWYPNDYNSKPQNESGGYYQQTDKQKAYDTQKNVNNTLVDFNKGNTTSAPGNYNNSVYDGSKGAKTIPK
jgi:hypothetical protein